MLLRHIYHRELAQASYLIGCSATGEALVVDPNRDIDQYIELAAREGLRVTAVTETHIHADFVSGSRELAARTGAQLYLSDEGPAEWKYAFAAESGARLLHDGDRFRVGNIVIEALHTPGHTPEHLSFLVTDTVAADEPMGILTGDFVFVGDVGRPDLLEKAAGVVGTMELGARQLFRSLQRFRELPPYVQVWPGHGAGSACGRALGAVPQSTVGYETRFGWAFAVRDEDAFVEAVLRDQPAPPRYFAEMKRVNKLGPALSADLPPIAQLPSESLADELALGSVIVDTRPADQVAAGHVRGTINLVPGSDFLTWAGWLLPYDQPVSLIAEQQAAPQIAADLRLIGIDALAGFWPLEAIDREIVARRSGAAISRLTPEDARRQIDAGNLSLLDVRTPQEYAAAHIDGSRHIPLYELPARITELPGDRPVLVHCQSGVRSAIAASLLSAHGHASVMDLIGGMNAWRAAGGPVAQPVDQPAEAVTA